MPNYPINETEVDPEVLVSKHRDGSEQRRLKGAGTKRTFKLPYGKPCPLTKAERDVILAHYAAELGMLNSFNWTHPETTEVIVCRYGAKPTFDLVGFDAWQGDVQLQEVPA